MLDDANPVGPYRAEDASPTDGVVAGTAGKVVGTITGVGAGVLAGVVAGVVARTRGMGAHAVGRYRVGDADPIDSAPPACDVGHCARLIRHALCRQLTGPGRGKGK